MTKVCTKCKVEKPISDFHRWAQMPDGYHNNCKQCKAAYRKIVDQQPHVLAKTKEYHFIRKYGITLAQYDEMFQAQNGLCAICFNPETHIGRSGKVVSLAVDHSHETGEVRGLLCHRCNVSLGNMNDDIQVLHNAISYLQKWEVKE